MRDDANLCSTQGVMSPVALNFRYICVCVSTFSFGVLHC